MLIALALLILIPKETDSPPLKVGEQAPAFSLPATTGVNIKLSDYKGKKQLVLAFFPKAFSGGCTREMSAFRDNQKAFDDAGAQVVGVSMDSLATQTKFADSLKLGFPILSDKNGGVATAYRVKGALWANRTTFVIDTDGKITAIFEGKDAIDPALTAAACKANVRTTSPR